MSMVTGECSIWPQQRLPFAVPLPWFVARRSPRKNALGRGKSKATPERRPRMGVTGPGPGATNRVNLSKRCRLGNHRALKCWGRRHGTDAEAKSPHRFSQRGMGRLCPSAGGDPEGTRQPKGKAGGALAKLLELKGKLLHAFPVLDKQIRRKILRSLPLHIGENALNTGHDDRRPTPPDPSRQLLAQRRRLRRRPNCWAC